ncbi:MAG: RNA polymerase sigma factor [Planctomycetaceae bacterium]|nr:RNA polymerase sigma factor [Planctomycetaceae bacterium]
MTEQDQTTLLAAIRRGDPAAWRSVIDSYEGRLQAFAQSRLNDPSLAQDVVQETFVGFLTSLPNYDETRSSLESFLFRIAAYKIADILRQKGRRGVSTQDDFAGKTDHHARRASSMMRSREGADRQRLEMKNTLQDIIHNWKEEARYERLKCCELLFVRGFSNQQVSRILEITEQQVANHKQAFLKKMGSLSNSAESE